MYGKKFVVLLAAAAVLLASPALARRDRRDSGLSVRQTHLDEAYARRHPTLVPGTPPRLHSRLNSSYGYVPPRRAAARRRRSR